MTLYPVPKPEPRIKAPKPLKARGRSRFPEMRDDGYRGEVKRLYQCALYGVLTWKQIGCRDIERPQPERSTMRYEHVCWGALEFAHVFKTQGMGAGDIGEGVILCAAAHLCFDQRWTRTEFGRYTGVTEKMLQTLAVKIAHELGYKKRAGVWVSA